VKDALELLAGLRKVEEQRKSAVTLYEAKLESMAAELRKVEKERDNLDKLYWECAIDFAGLRDFNAATKAAWESLAAGTKEPR